MTIDNNLILRLEFLEFKQQILLLKQPAHKINVFAELSLSEFLSIKEYVNKFEDFLINGYKFDFKGFEIGLYELCPKLKNYPESSVLIAKTLMDQINCDKLFSSNN